MNRLGDVTDSALGRAEVSRVRTPKIDRPIQGKSTISEVFSEHLDALEAKAAMRANEAESALDDVEKVAGAEKKGAAEKAEPAPQVSDAAELGLVARRFSHLLEIGVKNGTDAEQSLGADADKTVLTRPIANGSESSSAVPLRIDRVSIPLGAPPLKTADINSNTERLPTNGGLHPAPLNAGLTNGSTPEAARTGPDRASTLNQMQLPANIVPRHLPAQRVSLQPTASDGARPALNSVDRQTLDTLITVVRQETHAPPAVHLSPAAQVANALITSIQTPEASRLAQSAGEPMPTSPATSNVVRVLQIQLEPPELGTVSVRLKLEAHALELRISADQPGTADLIRRDQSVLTRLLQSAGYDVEGLSVYVAEADRSTMPGVQSTQQGSQGTPQQTTSYTSSGGGHPEGKFDEHHRPIWQDRAEDSVTAETSNGRPSVGASDRNGIYV